MGSMLLWAYFVLAEFFYPKPQAEEFGCCSSRCSWKSNVAAAACESNIIWPLQMVIQASVSNYVGSDSHALMLFISFSAFKEKAHMMLINQLPTTHTVNIKGAKLQSELFFGPSTL